MLLEILPPLCVPVAGQPWGASNEIDLNEGINYLVDADNLAAVPTEACGAIWCNGWTSIILCNGVSIAPNFQLLLCLLVGMFSQVLSL
jgi:hypothetical protein